MTEPAPAPADFTNVSTVTDTLDHLLQNLDLLPTVIDHLTGHLASLDSSGRLTLKEGSTYADASQVCTAAAIAAREGRDMLERGTRALRMMAGALTEIAPATAAPGKENG